MRATVHDSLILFGSNKWLIGFSTSKKLEEILKFKEIGKVRDWWADQVVL